MRSWNKFLPAAGILLSTIFSVSAMQEIDLESGWDCCIIGAVNDANADHSKCIEPPADADWLKKKSIGPREFVPRKEKIENHNKNQFNTWYRKTVKIPAEWRGKSIRLYQELNYTDAVVFVNGKKAGVIYRPFGFVELSDKINCGAENEIKLYYTNQYFGTGQKHMGYWGRDEGLVRMPNFFTVPKLQAKTSAYVEEVYADTSWRKKKITMRCIVYSTKKQTGTIHVKIAEDQSKKTVLTFSQKADLVPGENVINVEQPWKNPTTWEINRPFLYTAEIFLATDSEKICDTYPKFLFGFREIWTEGKEIMLNGHIQRFRGFWPQGTPKNLADIKKYGFTIAYETHQHYSVWQINPKEQERYDRAGVACAKGMPPIAFIHDAIRTDQDAIDQYRNHLKYWMRPILNCPSVLWSNCGVNVLCPTANMEPDKLAQYRETGPVADNIDFACKIARSIRPNCLYFSHADGSTGEISSSNLYFNFTPLQEREEWLTHWSERGIMPWYAAEFAAPYYACWFEGAQWTIRSPQMAEWLSVYYGEDAYKSENEDMLARAVEFTVSCSNQCHGGWVDVYSKTEKVKEKNGKEKPKLIQHRAPLQYFNPLADKYTEMLIYRTHRMWRANGLNGGLMYLRSWPWDPKDPALNRHRIANGDIVTFLGGAPDVADRTHAYYENEKIGKTLVFIWDGFGNKTLTAEWSFTDGAGKVLQSGKESVTLKQGDIVKKIITVDAPAVTKRTAYRFQVHFDGEDMDDTVQNDTFAVEVYPKQTQTVKNRKEETALFDPEKQDSDVLRELNVKFTEVKSIDEVLKSPSFKYLIIGKFALSTINIDPAALAKRVEEGLRVIIMPQEADVLQAMGFTVEDTLPRQMYNIRLSGVDDTDLNHWRGYAFPKRSETEGIPEEGCFMNHATKRGPRGTHHHAIAGLVFKIPEKTGFEPLIHGEFDMSYTPLMRITYGKGALTFCSLDFEGDRISRCPAATQTAAAVFNSFLNDRTNGTRDVNFNGKDAVQLARRLGMKSGHFDAEAKESILVVGKESQRTYAELQDFVKRGNKVLVVANANLAKDAGLVKSEKEQKFYRTFDRANFDKFPFCGIGLNMLRWRAPLKAVKLTAANGYTVAGDGLFAISADGNILFFMPEPGQLLRDNPGLHGARTVAPSEDHLRQFICQILTNWGAKPSGTIVQRSLYIKPAALYQPAAKEYFVLGPWPSEKDDCYYMIDKIGTMGQGGESTDILAQEMAIKGDVNPNPRFRPNGLKFDKESEFDYIDWRPQVKSNKEGFVNLYDVRWVKRQTFCTNFCVGYIERGKEEDVTLLFNAGWHAQVWLNGTEILRTYGGTGRNGIIYGQPSDQKRNYKITIHLKKGRNVFAIKHGSCTTMANFTAKVSKEIKPDDFTRQGNADLNDVSLYDSNAPLDPYLYIYW